MEKEKLIEVVKKSVTLAETLRGLGLRCAGGNYKTLNKYLKEYKVDITHFDAKKVKIDKLSNFFEKTKTQLDKILVESSTYDRKALKKRLYVEGLKKRICELCGQGEEWQGKKMSLILDHINGIHNDNRIENLRIVCPNCNATLDTHCGKNNSKRNKKIKALGLSEDTDLRKVLTDERKLGAVKRRKVERPPISEILVEVEKHGYSATGRKYGVSDNAVRKWLR